MIFFHRWLNKYTIPWQFMTIYKLWNSTILLNFKTSLVITHRLHPPTSLSRIAYENRFVTHPLSIFSSYLFNRIKIVPIHFHESSKPISLIKRRIEYLTKALVPRFSKIIAIIFQVSVGKSFTAIWENNYFYETEYSWSVNIHKTGPIPTVYCVQLSHAITCHFSKYFSILYIFEQISKYFAFFLKNHARAFTVWNRHCKGKHATILKRPENYQNETVL